MKGSFEGNQGESEVDKPGGVGADCELHPLIYTFGFCGLGTRYRFLSI